MKNNLLLYTFAHLCVDMICMWVMLQIFAMNPLDGVQFVLIYNFFAFAFQPIAGIISDKIKKPREMAVGGFVLMAVGVMLFTQFSVAGAIIIGMANSFFHVGGGVIVYNLNPETPKWQGVYIPSGGIGLALGALAFKTGILVPHYVLALLVVLAVLALFTTPPKTRYKKELSQAQLPKKEFWVLLAILFAVIAVRSFMGLEFADIAIGSNQKWLLAVAVALGKFAGGFLYERFGINKGLLLPLVCVLPLLFLGQNMFVLIVVSATVIQLSTAITLFMLFTLMPKRPGLAFGINCLAIFVGLVVVLFLNHVSHSVLAVIVSLMILLIYFVNRRITSA